MFIDECVIHCEGGRGGNGCMSFHREKFRPKGGPDGGCGGRGGDVVLVADPGLTSLNYFKYHRRFKAASGAHGSSNNKYGAWGEDLFVRVPCGTMVRDPETREPLADLVAPGDFYVAARGGRGGRGNAVFASSRRTRPMFAEKGEPGEKRSLLLELKLIAEVGLVGFPNVGKSTLLSVLSRARPKVADYPFTTLEPHLGVVELGKERSFVMADLPGLIEGASRGVGLGDRFLRHVERTRLLLHVVDMSGWEGRDPVEDYIAIRDELKAYSGRLAAKPEIVVANKMDVPQQAERNLEHFMKAFPGKKVVPVSAAARIGLDRLLEVVAEELDRLPPPPPPEEIRHVHRAEPIFVVSRRDDGCWEVSGRKVESLVAMTDLGNEYAVERMDRMLRALGVYGELERRGARGGDTVFIAGYEFEYRPDVPEGEGGLPADSVEGRRDGRRRRRRR